MTPHDLAAVFLRKARNDLTALTRLASEPQVADEIVGFHAQQAVEKALKAVLTSAGVRVGKTHDLNQLLKLLADAGIDAPDWLAETAQLTPFAAILRYIELELDTSVDRDAYCNLAERTLTWATERVGEG
jgi:HEPN domain-containing protein